MLSITAGWAQSGKPKYTYWFNSEIDKAVVGTIESGQPLHLDIDASELPIGINTIYLRAEGANGVLSSTKARQFISAKTIAGRQDLVLFLNVDKESPMSIPVKADAEGRITHEFDASQLPVGFHIVNAVLGTPEGEASLTTTDMFMRVPTTAEYSTLRGYYTIDGERKGEIDISWGKTIHLDLDVADLPSGLHSIVAYLAGSAGFASNTIHSFFYKIPLGGEGVKDYEYWINDEYSSRVKVGLDRATNPLQIIDMIEVEEQPIRSALFAFAIKDGEPVVYAKNQFNVRFYDPDGVVTYSGVDFIDERVSQSLEESDCAILTESGQMLIPEIPDNEIKWYVADCETGDSISLKADKVCTIQVFSPTGKEILATNEDAPLDAIGANLYETGRYYIAVHDIRGYDRRNLNIDFLHLNKYDVLTYTPQRTAHSPIIFGTLFGNGYDKLTSVSIKNETAQIPGTFYLRDKHNAAFRIDSNQDELTAGAYDLVLTFKDEDNIEEILTKTIIIEEAKLGDIRVDVESRQVPGEMPHPVAVRVTNEGNVPFLDIPLAIAYDTPENVTDIYFMDFNVLVSEETAKVMPFVVETDNLLGLGVQGKYMSLILPYLGAGESLTLTLGVDAGANARFNLYAFAGQPWSEEYKELVSQQNMPRRASEYKEPAAARVNTPRLRDMQSYAGEAVGVGIGIGQAIGGIANMSSKQRVSRYASMGAYPMGMNPSEIDPYRNLPVPTPGEIASNLPGAAGEIAGLANDISGLLNQCSQCPTPTQTPHPIETLTPNDPNDIRGYLSPAGTEHIGIGVKRVAYTIEFENEPETATAPAHTIVIKDNLDPQAFDLETFAMREFSIGPKSLKFNGESSFAKTLDLRPDVNVIAQIDFSLDANTGDAEWRITSLDPYTLNPAEAIMQGALPVNTDGLGIGELMFDIELRPNLADATKISNKATIIFDAESPIDTPIWMNATDYELPTSRITEIYADDNMEYEISVEGSDKGAGIWYYNLFMKEDEGDDWIQVKSFIEEETILYQSNESNPNRTFKVTAVDRANNMQDVNSDSQMLGDADMNGVVDASDILIVSRHYLGKDAAIDKIAADVNKDGVIDAQDISGIQHLYLNSSKNKIRKRISR
ncbi:MAG: dockerin type I repeat-containing protein [Clostridium sp.]|nr:dockerin type I repeat-containing protein [Clostridium sp.]